MSKDLNQCNFIGRLGRDPDIKYTPAGKAVANISIACGDDYKDKNSGEKVERTNWIRVVAFGRLGEIVGQYCVKGSRIFISGKQVTRKWQDQDGQDRYITEIVANEMQMLDSRSGGQDGGQGYQSQGSSTGQQAPEPEPVPMGDFDDSIPF